MKNVPNIPKFNPVRLMIVSVCGISLVVVTGAVGFYGFKWLINPDNIEPKAETTPSSASPTPTPTKPAQLQETKKPAPAPTTIPTASPTAKTPSIATAPTNSTARTIPQTKATPLGINETPHIKLADGREQVAVIWTTTFNTLAEVEEFNKTVKDPKGLESVTNIDGSEVVIGLRSGETFVPNNAQFGIIDPRSDKPYVGNK